MTKERLVTKQDIYNSYVTRATYAALAVSITLSFVKFLNYFVTGSVAIQASAIDSLMDIGVSFANFIAIKLTQRKPNSLFPFGYDKIASLIAFGQVILVACMAFYLLVECAEKLTQPEHIEHFGFGVIVIGFALFLNTILVWYQSKVVKKTGSLVIKADMFHYKTDFFTNFAILAGLFFVWAFNIHWLDPLIGSISGIYLLVSIFDLFKTSLGSLLDTSDRKLAKSVHQHLEKNGIIIAPENIAVIFTGTKHKVEINCDKLSIDNTEKINKLLDGYISNSIVEVKVVSQ